jgi:hypothetical protein
MASGLNFSNDWQDIGRITFDLSFPSRSHALEGRIASVFLLLALFGKQIDYLLSI